MMVDVFFGIPPYCILAEANIPRPHGLKEPERNKIQGMVIAKDSRANLNGH